MAHMLAPLPTCALLVLRPPIAVALPRWSTLGSAAALGPAAARLRDISRRMTSSCKQRETADTSVAVRGTAGADLRSCTTSAAQWTFYKHKQQTRAPRLHVQEDICQVEAEDCVHAARRHMSTAGNTPLLCDPMATHAVPCPANRSRLPG